MVYSRVSLLVAGMFTIGLAGMAPALAGPLAAGFSLSGQYTVNSAGGLTATGLSGTYAEIATGTYSFANSFTSLTTPYNLTLGGAITVNGTSALSGTSAEFTSSLGDLGTTLNAIPTYGALLVALGSEIFSSGTSGTLSYGGYDVAYIYSHNHTGSFSVGSNSNFVFGTSNATGNFTGDVVLTDVPEPSSLLLFGAGLLGVALVRRRRSI